MPTSIACYLKRAEASEKAMELEEGQGKRLENADALFEDLGR
ncbi:MULTISPECIES: hypothetical protein [Rhizobium]|nr:MULTISPECIES: hypothetical protein [Rhizobium]